MLLRAIRCESSVRSGFIAVGVVGSDMWDSPPLSAEKGLPCRETELRAIEEEIAIGCFGAE